MHSCACCLSSPPRCALAYRIMSPPALFFPPRPPPPFPTQTRSWPFVPVHHEWCGPCPPHVDSCQAGPGRRCPGALPSQCRRTTMLGMNFCFWHSVARASLLMDEQVATSLLRLHSYAHSYLPTLSLHAQLCAIYTRQVQTIWRGHPPPSGDGPSAVHQLGDHGDVLYASPQPAAAHGVSRGGTSLFYVFLEGLPGTMEGI